jgi:hypothetical protein
MKKMISIDTASLVLAFILFLAGLVLNSIYKPKLDEYKRLKQYEAERSKIELSHSGGGCLYFPPNWNKEKDGDWFNYELRSWDAGKNWYAVKINKNTGFEILGDAKVLYPKLLEHIEGMDDLTEYVRKNGSIDGRDSAGIKALEKAGFTVEIH